MMPDVTLQSLLSEISYKQILGNLDDNIIITGITYNSNAVLPGFIFVAIKGEKVDGHQYIDMAIKNGAVCIISEQQDIQLKVPVIVVKKSEITMAYIANILYQKPTEKLNVIGVTGTNGKTTVTHMIKKILDDHHIATGLIGTLGTKIGIKDLYEPTQHTTPQAPELQKLFYNMLNKNITHVVMEVSSHALSLNRVLGINFQTVVFTNLTQDHLDFHVTMDNYLKAKLQLFHMINDAVAVDKCAVINIDDPYAQVLIETIDPKKVTIMTYGIHQEADIKAEEITFDEKGLSFALFVRGTDYPVKLKLSGMFSVYNALAAIAAMEGNGYKIKDIVQSLETLEAIPGRFEIVSRKPWVIVDYAHTPDGLENVLSTAYELKQQFGGDLITLFGCGGDRDATKRPKMAEAADKYSDCIIVTSDNPRTEDPQQIITDILTGFKNFDTERILVEIDRGRAIEKAISMAQDSDIVLLAGKGHEDYQILGDRTIHFDDREEAKKLLKSLRKKMITESF